MTHIIAGARGALKQLVAFKPPTVFKGTLGFVTFLGFSFANIYAHAAHMRMATFVAQLAIVGSFLVGTTWREEAIATISYDAGVQHGQAAQLALALAPAHSQRRVFTGRGSSAKASASRGGWCACADATTPAGMLLCGRMHDIEVHCTTIHLRTSVNRSAFMRQR